MDEDEYEPWPLPEWKPLKDGETIALPGDEWRKLFLSRGIDDDTGSGSG